MQKSSLHLSLLFLLSTFFLTLHAQENIKYTVSSTKAIKIGTTKTVKESQKALPTSQKTKNNWKQVNKPPKDMKSRGTRHIVKPELEHQGPDPVRQVVNPNRSVVPIKILESFDGLTNGSPNDPTGDIGENHYVQAINATDIGVYDKDGELLEQFTGNSLWQPLGFTSAGDPIVLYDQEYNKWIITEFPNGNQLLIAISETSDPTGAYDVYNFNTPNFPDYPKYSIWNNSLTVTTNEEGPGNLHLYVLNRDQIMNGESEVDIQRFEITGNQAVESGFLVATPVDWTGSEKPNAGEGPYFLTLDDSSWGEADEDQINLWEVDIDWDNQDNSVINKTSIVTAPYDTYPCSAPGAGWACLPQPDGANGIDGLPDVIMQQSHYRKFPSHESIVLSFLTDVTDGDNVAGVRWIELRKSDGEPWSLYQEGTYAPDDGLSRFMSSICMDKFGNIALAYNVSSEDVYPGIRVTARRANDPLGMMTFEETTIVDGTNVVEAFGRFGDYAHMTIDPIDQATFWHTCEYGGDGFSNSMTRIAKFILEKEDYDLAVVSSSSPQTEVLASATPEQVVATISNLGKNAIDEFTVGYTYDGVSSTIETVNFNLEPDSFYVHTFSETVTSEMIKSYPLEIFVNATMDEAPANDTLKLDIKKLGNIDAAVANVKNINDLSFICESEFELQFELNNNGLANLTSVDYNIYENGSLIENGSWTGNLAYSESEIITQLVSNISSGDNAYLVEVINPNSTEDENSSNNSTEVNLKVDLEASNINLALSLDFFSSESSWEIRDESNDLLASGSNYDQPFQQVLESFCLPADQCFNLIIFDSASDGINNGNVVVSDSEGNELIAQTLGNFGAELTIPFCVGDGCMLSIEIDVTPSSSDNANDGQISINVLSGNPPFQFSIDDGQSFGSSNVFSGLDDGFYDVVVKDASNCIIDTFAIIDITAIDNHVINNKNIEISPNPNDGFFTMKIHHDGPVQMTYEIIDANGKVFNRNSINKYNDVYVGQVNITSFPAGAYYIIFNDRSAGVAKVIKY